MSLAKFCCAGLIACSCAAVPLEAIASPLPYVIELTAGTITHSASEYTCPAPPAVPPPGLFRFDCDIAVGETFVGTFSLVDTSILTGGVSSIVGTIEHFVLT